MQLITDWFLDSEKSVMKIRFIMFRRAGVFYSEDTTTHKQASLRTKDENEARVLLNAKNESFRQPNPEKQLSEVPIMLLLKNLIIWRVGP